MGSDPHSARKALVQAGFPPPAVEAMLRATPSTLRPDVAGVELLIEQRRRLPGADTGYDALVDGTLLPAG